MRRESDLLSEYICQQNYPYPDFSLKLPLSKDFIFDGFVKTRKTINNYIHK
jgi:hypothetical protein